MSAIDNKTKVISNRAVTPLSISRIPNPIEVKESESWTKSDLEVWRFLHRRAHDEALRISNEMNCCIEDLTPDYRDSIWKQTQERWPELKKIYFQK